MFEVAKRRLSRLKCAWLKFLFFEHQEKVRRYWVSTTSYSKVLVCRLCLNCRIFLWLLIAAFFKLFGLNERTLSGCFLCFCVLLVLPLQCQGAPRYFL